MKSELNLKQRLVKRKLIDESAKSIQCNNSFTNLY